MFHLYVFSFSRFPENQLSRLVVMQYVPEWMPGAGFKLQAKIWRMATNEMFEVPCRVVKDVLVNGFCSSPQ